jgi:hypothetical protein
MTEEEFFEWLDTCPSHKFEVMDEDGDSVRVLFKLEGGDND